MLADATRRRSMVDFGAGLSPDRRLLWDSFDVTLRERVEHTPFVGEDERVVARRLFGEPGGSTLSMSALARLGYSDLTEEPAVARMPARMVAGTSHPSPERSSAREALEVLWPASGRDRTGRIPTSSVGILGCWPWTDPVQPCNKDCRDSLVEDDDTCRIFIDCDEASRTVSEAELEAMAEEVPADPTSGSGPGPRIRGAQRTEKELIRAAWNYILANLDLVAWAICRVTGEVGDSRYSALLRRLAGQPLYRVTVRVFPVSGKVFALYGTGMIGIPRQNDTFVNLVSMWERGNHATRQCAALHLAVLLLHELMHLSGYTYVDLGDRCYVVYVVANLFRWALFHRYTDAAVPTCCTGYLDDNLVGCGTSTFYTGCDLDDEPSGVFGGSSGWFGRFLWWLITQGPTLAIDAAVYIVRGLLGAIVRGAREVVDWLGGLSSGFGLERSPSGCGCACQPCYEYCPDLWRDFGGSCQLRDPDDHEAVIGCLEACISLGGPSDAPPETMGPGPDGGDDDGQEEWNW